MSAPDSTISPIKPVGNVSRQTTLWTRPGLGAVLSLAVAVGCLLGGCAAVSSSWRHWTGRGGASQGAESQPASSPVVASPERPPNPNSKEGQGDSNRKGLFAVFETSEGQFVCRLLPESAPETVRNFVDLAQGNREWLDPATGQWVRRPFYDGLQFHRVVPGFIIQSGCPLNSGQGNPGYHIAEEIAPNLRHRRRGALGMATIWGQPNTVGSQFYITLGPAPELDGKCPIFGYVFEGLDVVDRIGQAAVDPQWRPLKPIRINQVRIVEQ